jgi:hypothetical protein
MVKIPDKAELAEYTQGQWSTLLDTLLTQDELLLGSATAQPTEPHFALASVFQDLSSPAAAEEFRCAVGDCLQLTPLVPSYARKLYYLLELTSFLKPQSARARLRQIVFHNLLDGVCLGSIRLSLLAVNTYSKFGIDDELAAFAKSLTQQTNSLASRLLGLRLLTLRSPEEGLRTFWYLLLSTSASDEDASLACELAAALAPFGFRSLFNFYHVLRKSRPDAPPFTRFQALMERHIAPWPERARLDPYGQLLALDLVAARQDVTASDLLTVATLEHQTDPEAVRATLRAIWSSLQRRRPQKYPWQTFSTLNYPNAFRSEHEVVTLTVGSETVEVPPGVDIAILESVELAPGRAA